MSLAIDVLVTLASYTGQFPKTLPYGNGYGFVPFPLNDFRSRMQGSFNAIDLEVDEGFFDRNSPKYPHNLTLLVLGIEKRPDFFYGLQDHNIGRKFGRKYEIAGGIVVEREKTGNFEFDYYNKVFVDQNLWGNGLAGLMLKVMKETKMPGVLRTSDPVNDAIYSKYGDIKMEICPYYFHGFGFVNKKGDEKFPGARNKFYAAARHIIQTKPVTVHHIKNGAGTNNLDLFSDPDQNLY